MTMETAFSYLEQQGHAHYALGPVQSVGEVVVELRIEAQQLNLKHTKENRPGLE